MRTLLIAAAALLALAGTAKAEDCKALKADVDAKAAKLKETAQSGVMIPFAALFTMPAVNAANAELQQATSRYVACVNGGKTESMTTNETCATVKPNYYAALSESRRLVAAKDTTGDLAAANQRLAKYSIAMTDLRCM
jgi:hypothetical protein